MSENTPFLNSPQGSGARGETRVSLNTTSNTTTTFPVELWHDAGLKPAERKGSEVGITRAVMGLAQLHGATSVEIAKYEEAHANRCSILTLKASGPFNHQSFASHLRQVLSAA